MTKSELVEAVAQKRDISKIQAESIVSCIFDTMFAALEHGDGIASCTNLGSNKKY